MPRWSPVVGPGWPRPADCSGLHRKLGLGIHALLGQVSRVTGLLRDQVTGEMHAVTARGLHEVEDTLGNIATRGDSQALETTYQAMSRVLAFAAALSGLAAENMVRGGGRLFLDLGRRVERAQAVADQIACALEFPGAAQQPARVEHGLRLALELCDSSITYRSRYLRCCSRRRHSTCCWRMTATRVGWRSNSPRCMPC